MTIDLKLWNISSGLSKRDSPGLVPELVRELALVPGLGQQDRCRGDTKAGMLGKV